MEEFFARLFGRRQASKTIAKERLNVIKNEILTVISKHVKVERDGIEMNLSHSQGQTRLVADIPIVSYRSRPGSPRKRKTAA
jgi:septum formation topological specificity factor MinE